MFYLEQKLICRLVNLYGKPLINIWNESRMSHESFGKNYEQWSSSLTIHCRCVNPQKT